MSFYSDVITFFNCFCINYMLIWIFIFCVIFKEPGYQLCSFCSRSPLFGLWYRLLDGHWSSRDCADECWTCHCLLCLQRRRRCSILKPVLTLPDNIVHLYYNTCHVYLWEIIQGKYSWKNVNMKVSVMPDVSMELISVHSLLRFATRWTE